MYYKYEIKRILHDKLDEALTEILEGHNPDCRYVGNDTVNCMTEVAYNVLKAIFDVQEYIDNEAN